MSVKPNVGRLSCWPGWSTSKSQTGKFESVPPSMITDALRLQLALGQLAEASPRLPPQCVIASFCVARRRCRSTGAFAANRSVVAGILDEHAVAHELDRLEEVRDRHAHPRGVGDLELVRVDRPVVADAPVARQVVGQDEQRLVRHVDGDQLQPVARAVVGLRRRERLVLELLAEPEPERLAAGEPVPAEQVVAAADELARAAGSPGSRRTSSSSSAPAMSAASWPQAR